MTSSSMTSVFTWSLKVEHKIQRAVSLFRAQYVYFVLYFLIFNSFEHLWLDANSALRYSKIVYESSWSPKVFSNVHKPKLSSIIRKGSQEMSLKSLRSKHTQNKHSLKAKK